MDHRPADDAKLLLDKIHELEREALIPSVVVVYPGLTEYAAAAQLGWYLQRDPHSLPSEEARLEGLDGDPTMPDIRHVQPLLASLVHARKLVKIGTADYSWMPWLDRDVTLQTLYATSDFAVRHSGWRRLLSGRVPRSNRAS